MIGHRLSARLRPDVEVAPWVISEIEKLEAELAALREQVGAIPEGYVLMPMEPTPQMLKALLRGVRLHSYVRKGMTIKEYSYHQDGWEAMLAAAQEKSDE